VSPTLQPITDVGDGKSTFIASQNQPVTIINDRGSAWTLVDGIQQPPFHTDIFLAGIGFDAGPWTPPPGFPAGLTNWLQVINREILNHTDAQGARHLNDSNLTDNLDNGFPYSDLDNKADETESLCIDAPIYGPVVPPVPNPPALVPPSNSDSEIDRYFTASMYYMWNPNLGKDANGNDIKCIWVPIKVMQNWHFYAKATWNVQKNIFEMSSDSTPLTVPWTPVTLAPGDPTSTPEDPTGEPTWTATVTNTGN
jgi:hypothetical protein